MVSCASYDGDRSRIYWAGTGLQSGESFLKETGQIHIDMAGSKGGKSDQAD